MCIRDRQALLYLISDKSFFILEAATGKVIVRKPLPYNVDVTSTQLLTDKEIIFGSAQKDVYKRQTSVSVVMKDAPMIEIEEGLRKAEQRLQYICTCLLYTSS